MASYDLAAELVGTGVSVNAVHPATYMDTAMVREAGQPPAADVDEGLAAVARLVTDPELDGVSGRYFDRTREAQPDPQADDPAMRSNLAGTLPGGTPTRAGVAEPGQTGVGGSWTPCAFRRQHPELDRRK